MNWAVLIPVIAQWGIPLAEKLWQLATTNTEPTQADWDALKALSQETARTQMVKALQRANVPLDSPQALALLALVP